MTGHQLELSASRAEHATTVRMIATCSCLGWWANVVVAAPAVRDADTRIRRGWTEHSLDPAPAPMPAWLVGGAA